MSGIRTCRTAKNDVMSDSTCELLPRTLTPRRTPPIERVSPGDHCAGKQRDRELLKMCGSHSSTLDQTSGSTKRTRSRGSLTSALVLAQTVGGPVGECRALGGKDRRPRDARWILLSGGAEPPVAVVRSSKGMATTNTTRPELPNLIVNGLLPSSLPRRRSAHARPLSEAQGSTSTS